MAEDGSQASTAAGDQPSKRCQAVLMNLAGRLVRVQHADGSAYEGVLHSFDLSADGAGLELRLCSKLGKLDELAKKPDKQRVFRAPEVVRIDCKYNAMEELQSARTQVLNEVRADTEISSGTRGQARELTAWVADQHAPSTPEVDLNDWDDANRKKEFAGWDQFAVNEQKFGVKSTYDENLYTTVLDKTSLSKDAMDKAARIAAEIEGTASANAHVAEERGQQAQADAAYDEEARYSTVLRGDEANVHLKGAKAGAGPSAAKGAAPAAAPPAKSGAPTAAAATPAKKTLNPNAKEFTFNPNAKEFTPSQAAPPVAQQPMMPLPVQHLMGPGQYPLPGYQPGMMPGFMSAQGYMMNPGGPGAFSGAGQQMGFRPPGQFHMPTPPGVMAAMPPMHMAPGYYPPQGPGGANPGRFPPGGFPPGQQAPR